MPDNRAKIEKIRAILASGVTTAVRDGATVTFDHDSLRKELAELERTDDTHRGKRPVASRIKLGGR